MKLAQITVEHMMAHRPCPNYTTDVVRKLWGRRRALTARQIADLDIPPQDVIWAVTQDGVLPKAVRLEFAARCAERALRRECRAGREPDKRSWEAIRVLRRFIRGAATVDELRAAAYAADAAHVAAAAAAADAAYATAYIAATDYIAADAADAAYAGDAAERRWQVGCLKRLLGNPPRWLVEVVEKGGGE